MKSMPTIEKPTQECQETLILSAYPGLERAKGIEPSYAAWEAADIAVDGRLFRPFGAKTCPGLEDAICWAKSARSEFVETR
jgi:hypothetical protein